MCDVEHVHSDLHSLDLPLYSGVISKREKQKKDPHQLIQTKIFIDHPADKVRKPTLSRQTSHKRMIHITYTERKFYHANQPT